MVKVQARTVGIGSGARVVFDGVIIATGSEPRRPAAERVRLEAA
ncbi:hypothetical protein [Nesterenkonia salmonea]|nr:hypothetical protein [Nesterenkonia salmonea]